jgi:hypothetical protein
MPQVLLIAKFEKCYYDLNIHVSYIFSTSFNVTKWIKSKQLMCPDPKLLHDMWIKCINISTITIKMSQDTLTTLITAVITISIMQLGYFV